MMTFAKHRTASYMAASVVVIIFLECGRLKWLVGGSRCCGELTLILLIALCAVCSAMELWNDLDCGTNCCYDRWPY